MKETGNPYVYWGSSLAGRCPDTIPPEGGISWQICLE